MAYSTFSRHLRLARVFLAREYIVLKKDLISTATNAVIWPIMISLIYGFVMPLMGVRADYGSFILIGGIIAGWVYVPYGHAAQLSADLQGKRLIEYELTLPVNPAFIIIKQAMAFTYHTLIFSLPLLFVGKLVLGERLSFVRFSALGFIFMNVLCISLFSFFAIWVCAWTTQRTFGQIRIRLFDPMFFMGCHMATWETFHQGLPIFANVMLLNPVTYAMEATRAMVFGPADFINIWISIVVLIAQLGLWAFLAIYAMRKRLDYVKV